MLPVRHTVHKQKLENFIKTRLLHKKLRTIQDENCRRVVSVPNAFYGAGATEVPTESNYRKRPFSSYNIQVKLIVANLTPSC